jgi:hypothetical protein
MGARWASVCFLFAGAIFAANARGCAARSQPGAERTTPKPPLRTAMSAFSLASPGLITIHEEGQFDFTDTYAVGVLGPRRLLHTAEFVQRGRELEELKPTKWVSWDVPVPENARIFAAGSGISPKNTHQFWVGWLVGRHVHMQALMQEKPIETDLAADETPIFPAITDGSGAVSLYTWRPAPGGATALWRHTFKGAIKTAGTASAEALSEIPGRPVVSVAGAIPGERAAHALIGWVESGSEGAVLGIAVVMPTRMRVVRSKPLRDLVGFVNQRPGIWAGVKTAAGQYQLAAVVQSRTGAPAYHLAIFNVGGDAGEGRVDLDTPVPPGTLHAAAFDYERDNTRASLDPAFLTKDGTLWFDTHPPMIKRRGVDLDSPLPIATTSYVYWGTRAPDGTITFEQL